MTVYECGECGYQLLPADEVKEGHFIDVRRGIGGLWPGLVCRDPFACARRVRHGVAGRTPPAQERSAGWSPWIGPDEPEPSTPATMVEWPIER